MSPERFPPDDPREWLNRARSNLARAKARIPEAYGETVPDSVRKAEDLTRYAVVTRYPGLAEPVTGAHYQEAIESAEAVVHWAEEKIE